MVHNTDISLNHSNAVQYLKIAMKQLNISCLFYFPTSAPWPSDGLQ